MCLSENRCFAPLELQGSFGAWFYKHLVPSGTEYESTGELAGLLRRSRSCFFLLLFPFAL